MGINTSLSLQESWHLPPSSISLDGQTLDSLARETTPPCLPSFPRSPSLSPHSPNSLTYLQREELLMEMESQAQLSKQHLAPRRHAFENL